MGRALPRRRADDRRRPHARVPLRARRRQRRATRSSRTGCGYAVAQDNDYATWNAYGNQYWPAKYLIDARGRVRYTHFGEGDYEETEEAIRELLAEAGHGPGAQMAEVAGRAAPRRLVTTPESYLGAARADRFVNGPLALGHAELRDPAAGSRPRQPRLRGQVADRRRRRHRRGELAPASGLRRPRVFLVLGSRGNAPRQRAGDARRQADRGRARRPRRRRRPRAWSRDQRLYRLVELPRAERHLLTPRLGPGVSGYAFTFG